MRVSSTAHSSSVLVQSLALHGFLTQKQWPRNPLGADTEYCRVWIPQIKSYRFIFRANTFLLSFLLLFSPTYFLPQLLQILKYLSILHYFLENKQQIITTEMLNIYIWIGNFSFIFIITFSHISKMNFIISIIKIIVRNGEQFFLVHSFSHHH